MVEHTHNVQYRPVTKAAPTDGMTDRVSSGAMVTTTGGLVASMSKEEADRFGVDLERSGVLYLELPAFGVAGLEAPAVVRTRPITDPAELLLADDWIYWRVSAGAVRRDAGDDANHLYIPLVRLDSGYPTGGWV